MTALEIALLVLVSIWSLIFLIIAVGLIIILTQVKRGLDRVNHILESGEQLADGVSRVTKGVAGIITGQNQRSVKNSVKRLLAKKSRG